MLFSAGWIGMASGCAMLGTTAITTGRLEYSEALARTEAQQMLLNIIRNRYGEATTMLTVSSVAANMTLHAEAGIALGFGPPASYAGALIPFSGSTSYDENPTISYAPVQGREALHQLFSPLPLDVIIALAHSAAFQERALRLLVRRINEVENPDFLASPNVIPAPRFARLVALITALNSHGKLFWVQQKAAPSSDAKSEHGTASPSDAVPQSAFAMVLHGYAQGYLAEVQELLGLLGAPAPETPWPDIVLNVSLAVGPPPSGGVALITRSVIDLIVILAAAADVPEEDVDSGRVAPSPPMGLAGRNLHIRRATRKPGNASVAVPYRNAWFYIADTDLATKQYFQMLQVLWSVAIAQTAATQLAPILTVPVSK
jgi:hypothetical protein